MFLLEWMLHWDAPEVANIPCHVLPFPPCTDSPHQASIDHLARGCLAGLSRHAVQGPFILVGYSMAGFVAVEMARQLALAGRPPLDVWLVDSVLPTRWHRVTHAIAAFLGRGLGLAWNRQLLLGRIAHGVAEIGLPISQARFAEALKRARSEMERFETWLPAMRDGRPSMSPVPASSPPGHHRIHAWANHSHRPIPYEGRAACFLTRPTQLDQPGPLHGWAQALPHADVIEIPGTHGSCIRRHRQSLLAAFRQRLSDLPGATALAAARAAAVLAAPAAGSTDSPPRCDGHS